MSMKDKLDMRLCYSMKGYSSAEMIILSNYILDEWQLGYINDEDDLQDALEELYINEHVFDELIISETFILDIAEVLFS